MRTNWKKIAKELAEKNQALSDALAETRRFDVCGNQGNGRCMLPPGHELPHYNPRGGTWVKWKHDHD